MMRHGQVIKLRLVAEPPEALDESLATLDVWIRDDGPLASVSPQNIDINVRALGLLMVIVPLWLWGHMSYSMVIVSPGFFGGIGWVIVTSYPLFCWGRWELFRLPFERMVKDGQGTWMMIYH